MSFAQILLLAVGLAMDATAVAATRGVANVKNPRVGEVFELGLAFGFAQGLMPWLGALLGERVGSYVASFDHWIAFIVLGVIGGKMIHEALTGGDEESEPGTSWRLLLALAIATSIDAFAVGLTLPLLGAPLLLSVLTIGVVTALLSGVGVLLGRRFGALLGKRLDIFGGVVLIALGLKILIEHLTTEAG